MTAMDVSTTDVGGSGGGGAGGVMPVSLWLKDSVRIYLSEGTETLMM